MIFFGSAAGATAPKPVSISPVEYLRQVAGIDFPILYRIAKCESNFRANAKNPTSTASGIFQFLKNTWAEWGQGDVFDPYRNIDAAVRLYRAEGTRPWLSSEKCWRIIY